MDQSGSLFILAFPLNISRSSLLRSQERMVSLLNNAIPSFASLVDDFLVQ